MTPLVVGVFISVAGLVVLMFGVALWPPRKVTEPVPMLGESGAPGSKYNLVVLNDDMHTYNYVVGLLGEVFGVSGERAFAFARAIGRLGRVVVFSGSRDEVNSKRDQILAWGPDSHLPHSSGPLSVEILEAE